MECRFIMRSPPTRIHIDAPAMDAVNLMVIKHMQNLPVVDHEERFLGEIGVQGILGRMLPLGLTEHPESNRLNFLRETLDDLRDKFHTIVDLPISEIMDKDVPRVAPDTPILEAVRLLIGYPVTLPVVEDKTERLIGAVSFITVLRALEEGA